MLLPLPGNLNLQVIFLKTFCFISQNSFWERKQKAILSFQNILNIKCRGCFNNLKHLEWQNLWWSKYHEITRSWDDVLLVYTFPWHYNIRKDDIFLVQQKRIVSDILFSDFRTVRNRAPVGFHRGPRDPRLFGECPHTTSCFSSTDHQFSRHETLPHVK